MKLILTDREQSDGLDRPDVLAMYETPLPAARTGPLYNAFSYPTKISPEAIALFIATHTPVGGVVLDVFSGSGTAGVATILCERPTPLMIREAARLGVVPQWGRRDAHLFDVGVLGSFIARNLTNPPDPDRFGVAAAEMLDLAAARLTGAYAAVDPEEGRGSIRHVIWSEVIVCTACGADHRLWDVATARPPARFLKIFKCDRCGADQSAEACPRREVDGVDVFGRPVRQRMRVPVEVHGLTGRRKWVRAATEDDLAVAAAAGRIELPRSAPDAEIAWGELHRSGYHTGISHLHHFYTPRNFTALAVCMETADRWPEPMRSALRFLILSYNASHSTLMTRIVAKRDQPEFVLTGAQSGVLYVSGLPVEKNVLAGIARKAAIIRNAFAMTHGAAGRVHVHNATSERLPIGDETIDYVFTDPPFGDYIPYAEINQINELWLGAPTDRAAEAVVSVSGNKDVASYQTAITSVFSETHRVLKPEGLATVVFHSAHARIWRALTSALAASRLQVRCTSVLDKLQASFKQVVSTVSVKGDPLILLGKMPAAASGPDHDAVVDDIIEAARVEIAPDVRALFSRYAASCLAAGRDVELDADEFGRRLNSALEPAT